MWRASRSLASVRFRNIERRHLTLTTSLQKHTHNVSIYILYTYTYTYTRTICSKSWSPRDFILHSLSKLNKIINMLKARKTSGRFMLFHVVFFVSRGGTATPPGSLRLLERGWNEFAKGISPWRRPRGPELWRPRPRAATLKEFCASLQKYLDIW